MLNKMFLKKISDKFKTLLNKNVQPTTQSFTYYIPAPPHRSTGYREKEFDRIMNNLFKEGHKLISIKTATHNGPDHAGMWVICLVKPSRANSKVLNLNFDEKNSKQEIKLDDQFTIIHD